MTSVTWYLSLIYVDWVLEHDFTSYLSMTYGDLVFEDAAPSNRAGDLSTGAGVRHHHPTAYLNRQGTSQNTNIMMSQNTLKSQSSDEELLLPLIVHDIYRKIN